MSEFRQILDSLYDKTLDRWREYTASTSLVYRDRLLPPSLMKCELAYISIALLDLCLREAKALSTDLLRSLIALSMSTLQLSLPRDPTKRNQVVDGTLRSFISQYFAKALPESEEQVIYDLAILQQIVKQHGEGWDDIQQELAKRLKEVSSI